MIANQVFKQTLQTYDSNTTGYEKTKKTVNSNFLGETAERWLKSCIRKLYIDFERENNDKFGMYYQTTQMLFFAITKDKTPRLSRLSLVYKFTYPGSSRSYIGKAERTSYETVK